MMVSPAWVRSLCCLVLLLRLAAAGAATALCVGMHMQESAAGAENEPCHVPR